MKIFRFLIITFALIILNTNTQGQKAKLDLRYADSLSPDYREHEFEVTIRNIGYKKLIIQDTSYLKKYIGIPIRNLITPYFYKKINGSYQFVEAIPRSGIQVPGSDSCLEKCCNCIILKKATLIKLRLKLLSCCPLEKGDYKLMIELRPPFMAAKRKWLIPLESNYVYFEIK